MRSRSPRRPRFPRLAGRPRRRTTNGSRTARPRSNCSRPCLACRRSCPRPRAARTTPSAERRPAPELQLRVNNPPGLPAALKATGMQAQFGQFLATPRTYDLADSLVVVWGGPNDLFLALATGGNPVAAAGQAVTNLAGLVGGLAAGGGHARSSSPTSWISASTPFGANSGNAAGLTALTVGFNAGLNQAMAQVESSFPGVDITVFDTFSLFGEAVATPGAFGLTNVKEPCYRQCERLRGVSLLRSGAPDGAGAHDPRRFVPRCSRSRARDLGDACAGARRPHRRSAPSTARPRRTRIPALTRHASSHRDALTNRASRPPASGRRRAGTSGTAAARRARSGRRVRPTPTSAPGCGSRGRGRSTPGGRRR